MKKLVVLLLSITMSLSLLVGCGESGNKDTGNDSNVNQDADVNQDDESKQDNVTNQENDDATSDASNGCAAPTELGATLDTLTFRLEGAYYQFPMPVSEFLKNDWNIPAHYQTDELIQPGEYYNMAFNNEKGYTLYEVRILNTADVPQKIENCMVNRMLITAEHDFDFELPQGITFASTLDELKAVTAQDSMIQNGNYMTCTWDNEEWTDSIAAWYHPEEGIEYFELCSWN